MGCSWKWDRDDTVAWGDLSGGVGTAQGLGVASPAWWARYRGLGRPQPRGAPGSMMGTAWGDQQILCRAAAPGALTGMGEGLGVC